MRCYDCGAIYKRDGGLRRSGWCPKCESVISRSHELLGALVGLDDEPCEHNWLAHFEGRKCMLCGTLETQEPIV